MGSGYSQSSGLQEMPEDVIQQVFSFPKGLDMDRHITFHKASLTMYSIFKKDDPDRAEVIKKLWSHGFSTKMDKAMGSLLGLVVGDALGAPLEFMKVRYGEIELQGLDHDEMWKMRGHNKFDLKPGQWTDDSSMALCLADSLLVNKGLHPKDLRLRFLNWWSFGYCNAFGHDIPKRGSVGLGGNICQSFDEFEQKRTDFTTAGNKQTCGNGSLMRNAPVPIYYANDMKTAEETAYKQSKTTHQGDEAAECCRLLTHIVVTAINGDGTKQFLKHLSKTFSSPVYSITCLAKSKQEKKGTRTIVNYT